MRHLMIGFLVGTVAGLCCFGFVSLFGIGAGDFTHALVEARDVLAGRNPYAHPPGPYWIPYPLTAAMLALPFVWLPNTIGAGCWFGISTGVLTCGILRAGESWRLGMLFSWPFVYAAMFAQWSPLLTAISFLPELAVLVLCKPNIAWPMIRTIPREPWMWVGVFWLVTSIVYRPSWPLEWMRQVTQYQGIVPPILSALGPLVVTVLIRWRDRRSWLILAMACTPQRVFYDQLGLLLVAERPKELFWLVGCSWASFFALWLSPDMAHMPGGWSLWVMLAHYLPAVGVLLYKERQAIWQTTETVKVESAH